MATSVCKPWRVNITLPYPPRLARNIISPYTTVNRCRSKSCASISIQCSVVLVRPQCLAFEVRKRAINKAHLVVRAIVEGDSGAEVEGDEIIVCIEGIMNIRNLESRVFMRTRSILVGLDKTSVEVNHVQNIIDDIRWINVRQLFLSWVLSL